MCPMTFPLACNWTNFPRCVMVSYDWIEHRLDGVLKQTKMDIHQVKGSHIDGQTSLIWVLCHVIGLLSDYRVLVIGNVFMTGSNFYWIVSKFTMELERCHAIGLSRDWKIAQRLGSYPVIGSSIDWKCSLGSGRFPAVRLLIRKSSHLVGRYPAKG